MVRYNQPGIFSWCVEGQFELVHIQPGKPTQNAHFESFHDDSRKWGSMLASELIRCGGRSRHGRRSATRNAPTAAWDIKHRKSLLLPEVQLLQNWNWGQEASNAGVLPSDVKQDEFFVFLSS